MPESHTRTSACGTALPRACVCLKKKCARYTRPPPFFFCRLSRGLFVVVSSPPLPSYQHPAITVTMTTLITMTVTVSIGIGIAIAITITIHL